MEKCALLILITLVNTSSYNARFTVGNKIKKYININLVLQLLVLRSQTSFDLSA